MNERSANRNHLDKLAEQLRAVRADPDSVVAEPSHTVDRDKLLEVLRGAVEDEWLTTLAELRAGGLKVSADWPNDPRWCLTLSGPDGAEKAATFGVKVDYTAGAVALAKVVRRAMAGSAATIRAWADQVAPGLTLLVRSAPTPVFALDLTVHVRCRLGFLRTEPEVVELPTIEEQRQAGGLLTPEQLMAETARAAGERRYRDPEELL